MVSEPLDGALKSKQYLQTSSMVGWKSFLSLMRLSHLPVIWISLNFHKFCFISIYEDIQKGCSDSAPVCLHLSVSETIIGSLHHGLWWRCRGLKVEHIRVKVIASVWIVSFLLEMTDDSAVYQEHWHLWSHRVRDPTALSAVWVSTTGGNRLTASTEISWPSVCTAAMAASELCLHAYFSFVICDLISKTFQPLSLYRACSQ